MARHDHEIADLIGHRPVIAVEPLLGAMPQVGRSLVLQGLEQIVGHHVRRVMSHQARSVLGVHRLDAVVHEDVDFGLDGRGCCHGHLRDNARTAALFRGCQSCVRPRRPLSCLGLE
jgi:hypothetical protein